jgi:hypothetical protein
MGKIKTLRELYKGFAENPLQPNRDEGIYVPLFEREITNLIFTFEGSVLPYEYVYVAGQSGVGKTSALNFLCSDEEISKQYDVLSIYANEHISSNTNEIDVILLLMQLGYKIIEKEPQLSKIFADGLDKIKNKIAGKYSEESTESVKDIETRDFGLGFKIGLPTFLNFFSAGFDLKANLKNDKETQKVIKHYFSFSKEDLKKMIDKMTEKYQEIHHKSLLVIFHDLERMTDYEAIKTLFLENRQYFQQTHCRKIISLPAALIAENTFTEPKELFALKVAENPMSSSAEDRALIEQTYQKFRKLALVRIDDSVELIHEDALRKAFELSGGVVRQYIQLIRLAARNTALNDGKKITANDIDQAGIDFTNAYLQPHAINGNDFEVMKFVDDYHTNNFDEKLMSNFGSLVQGNKILAYKNAVNWFSINPLLRRQFEFMKRSKQNA